MKQKYSLIAFDLDWTLLDRNKKIPEENLRAIRLAAEAGKTIVLSTGRGIDRVQEYYDELPEVQYSINNNGCIVYDVKNKKKLFHETMDIPLALRVLQTGRSCSIGSIIVSDELMETEDYLRDPFPVEKINFYFSNDWEREAGRTVLEKLPIEVVPSDSISLECTEKGMTKGSGLKQLCRILNIPLAETIACGDSGNDLEILKTAGLAAAVANADEEVKRAADVIVPDCDHAGCAEVIYKYLLGES